MCVMVRVGRDQHGLEVFGSSTAPQQPNTKVREILQVTGIVYLPHSVPDVVQLFLHLQCTSPADSILTAERRREREIHVPANSESIH